MWRVSTCMHASPTWSSLFLFSKNTTHSHSTHTHCLYRTHSNTYTLIRLLIFMQFHTLLIAAMATVALTTPLLASPPNHTNHTHPAHLERRLLKTVALIGGGLAGGALLHRHITKKRQAKRIKKENKRLREDLRSERRYNRRRRFDSGSRW